MRRAASARYSRRRPCGSTSFTDYTYTLETIIQAGQSDMAVTPVPVRTNPRMRESRLFRSTPQYVMRSVETILRVDALYEPLRIFLWLAVVPGLAGLVLCGRFAWYLSQPGPTGHVQSLVIGAVLLLVAVQLVALGILADLLRGTGFSPSARSTVSAGSSSRPACRPTRWPGPRRPRRIASRAPDERLRTRVLS